VSLISGVVLVLWAVTVVMASAPGRLFGTPQGYWISACFFAFMAAGTFAVGVLLVVGELRRPDWQGTNDPGFAAAIYVFIGTGLCAAGSVLSMRRRRELIALEETRKAERAGLPRSEGQDAKTGGVQR
jgi:hypothetical protein